METFTRLFGSLLLFVYHCFDRVVINGYLGGLSRPGQVVHFFQHVVGEPVIGQFELFPNNKVFEKAAVVLSDRVPYGGEPQEAEQLLSIFLRRVNETAVLKGVIPDPLQGTVGALPVEKYFEAVTQLRRLKGPVEITAVTTETIFSAGPLHIAIQVQSVPSLQ